MKKKITAALILFAAAFLAFTAAIAFSQNKIPASAYSYYGDYSFNVAAYDVVCDINADCTINYTETITINYTGSDSTGFMRDIPLAEKTQIRNVTVCELINGSETSVDYDVYFYSDDDYDYLTADIGDLTNKTGESHTYIIRYDYIGYKNKEVENKFSVNAIGTGWSCDIYNATVTVNAPEGLIADSAKCYVGSYNSSNATSDYVITGNTITLSCSYLSSYNGVTFDLYFEDGALASNFNALPWLLLLIGALILAALIVLKFVKFTDPPLTPVVNFTAPDDMDPLAVGQLIDGQISNEDVTSLIYYWADKGFLKINMADENDPVLIRVYKNLPESYPDYQKGMYAAMFASGDSVKVSSLSEKFYTVIERVKKTAAVDKRTMYDGGSRTAAVIFAILGGLFAALLPILLLVIQVSSKLFNVAYLFAVIPSVVVFALTLSVFYFRYKRKKSISILLLSGIALIGGAMVALYALLVPYAAFETAPKIIAEIISVAIGMLSVTLIVRTKLYNEQLNGIIGFKNFILYAEKDRLEAMLEDDPQLYYHILPYAQVLGVTDKWEDKFKALTIEPPQWIVDPLGTYIGFVAINRCMRLSFTAMNRHMVSRPPSAGGGGGRGGFGGGGGFSGGFGGFAGGGFGGGGGRGR